MYKCEVQFLEQFGAVLGNTRTRAVLVHVGGVLVLFWCSFGAALVQFWRSCGAVLVHFWCSSVGKFWCSLVQFYCVLCVCKCTMVTDEQVCVCCFHDSTHCSEMQTQKSMCVLEFRCLTL